MKKKDEKLQKVLARAGFGSRRELEAWITAGRVSVDGKKAKLGDRVTSKQRIRVDGHPIRFPDKETFKRRVLLYNKPEGEICTQSDPENRPTVYDHLPRIRPSRWIAIGRLDINSSGLLLFTNDGELANKFMHPSSQIEREYAVRVLGDVDQKLLATLRKGVKLEDGIARFEGIKHAGGEGANQWYHVLLKEGRNREVRRLWESQNIKVSRLIRIRFGQIKLPRDLRQGRWIEIDSSDLK